MEGKAANRKQRRVAVELCLHALQRLNKFFMRFTLCMQTLLLPQLTAYDRRVIYMAVLQLIASDFMVMTLMKMLQFFHQNTNFMLVLSLSNLLPFAKVVWSLWTYIPCPNMAAVISNVSLVFCFVLLLVLGLGTYSGFWVIYTFIMASWPWLILASMISRLFIDRNLGKNPFSPIRELPFLGLLGAFAQIFMLIAIKDLNICDAVVLSFLDPVLAALVASVMMGRARMRLHARQVKVYLLIIGLVMLYVWGEVGPGELQVTTPSTAHGYFLLARFLLVLRSIFVKWQYAAFSHAAIPDRPPEDSSLFFNTKEPKMHRFKMFPGPVLHTLDAIFDSGLRDTDLHGMGPLGTQDLYSLTEFSYLMPVASLMAWLMEQNELKYGFLPPGMYEDSPATAQSSITAPAGSGPTVVTEEAKTSEVLAATLIVLGIVLSRFLVPISTSKALFDRGSSCHSWKYVSLFLVAPFFMFDVLYLNERISKFQIMMAGVGMFLVGYYRHILWTLFKRKFYLLSSQQLQYFHPSVLRTLQKRTLLEFLHNTSIEDYGVLLLETVIRNGNNIREIARDTRILVWDPSPTATAAWKLAFSLVTKSIRKQKQTRLFKQKEKESVTRFVENLVVELAYNAVDLAEGHGGRLVLAKSLAGVVAKRCALRKLQRLAVRRRTLRHRRKMGQLASVPLTLASADGVIRPVKDMVTLDKSGMLPQMRTTSSNQFGQLALPSASGNLVAQTQMSLTASQSESAIDPYEGTNASTGTRSPPRLPNSIMLSDTMDVDSPDSSPTHRVKAGEARNDGRLRGIWHMAQMDGTGSPVATTVLAFGDCKCGQTGLSEADVAKRGHASVIVVEDLRGCYPAQVEAAGGGSFVVNGQGKIYCFGSNRSLELGLRKDVVQVTTPQLMKSMRHLNIVQIASTSSASGQAHTLALTDAGEVVTFGTSARGALGQGPEVRQTPPLLMRLTIEVRILFVSAGARHSLMVADSGKVFSFGDNTCGQLGTDMVDEKKKALKYADTPVVVGGPLFDVPVVRIAVGDDHNLAVTEDSKVYAWGANANGQLGIGRLDDQHRPVMIEELKRFGVKDVSSLACGARHSLVVTNQGTNLWAFGSNVQGQLGTGQNNNEFGHQLSLPKLCRGLSNVRDTRIVQVVAASSHSLALTQVGEVFAWGDNSWGQLGFPREGSTDYSNAHASRRQAPSAFGATSSAFAMSAHVKGRKASEIDAPLAFAEGVAQLSVPTRVVGLSLQHVRFLSTADTHTLALAS